MDQAVGFLWCNGDVANPSPLNCPTPFLIPIGAISAQVGKILGLFPAPNNSNLLNNFIAGGAGPFKQNSFDTRIDYSVSQSMNAFGRFSLDYFNLSGKGGLGVMGGARIRPGRSGRQFDHPQHQYGGWRDQNSQFITAD